MVRLVQVENLIHCKHCGAKYEIRNGIPILIPNYQNELHKRYLDSYERLARDDLDTPVELEGERQYRHEAFLDFIGSLKGKRVLDIGSSNARYLSRVEADFKVAFDIAFPYLNAIPVSSNIACICGDAEFLPFRPGFFDIILLSDVLEHVLDPEKLVEKLALICDEDTRVFVHIPWEEQLESYRNSSYEYTHLRSFNAFNYGQLWRRFYIRRMRETFPDMNYPFIFRLQGKIPLTIYNKLVYRYFFTPDVAEKDFQWRYRKVKELPKNEKWLLWLFKPKFKMFEMRLHIDFLQVEKRKIKNFFRNLFHHNPSTMIN